MMQILFGKPQRESVLAKNPHPVGSDAWHEWEHAATRQAVREVAWVLAIAIKVLTTVSGGSILLAGAGASGVLQGLFE